MYGALTDHCIPKRSWSARSGAFWILATLEGVKIVVVDKNIARLWDIVPAQSGKQDYKYDDPFLSSYLLLSSDQNFTTPIGSSRLTQTTTQGCTRHSNGRRTLSKPTKSGTSANVSRVLKSRHAFTL
jgi:hypothetical protein